MNIDEKVLLAAKKAKDEHFKKKTRKKPKRRRRALRLSIPFSNFYNTQNYEEEKHIKNRFQTAIRIRKSPFRDLLRYKHRGEHEPRIIAAFVNKSINCPFDMLSYKTLLKIINVNLKNS